MRRNIVAGNWKMNKTMQEGIELTEEIVKKFPQNAQCDVVIAPPFPYISTCVERAKNSNLQVSSQNCAAEEKGAYTGEVSAQMIASVGAKYAIIGHSERRSYYSETNEILKKKTELALKHNLQPIFCIGEVLEERESNKHFEVIKSQLNESLFQLSKTDFAKIIIAYEPVWAIGTGLTATPEQAQEMHAYIRKQIEEIYDSETADNTSILYGGSCKPSNAKELFANKDVDGGLIGGASLVADDFLAIVQSF